MKIYIFLKQKKSQNPILNRKKTNQKYCNIWLKYSGYTKKNTHMIIHREQNIENIIDELLKVHLENKIDKLGRINT